MNSGHYLVVPKRDANRMTDPTLRGQFSLPVRVEPLYSSVTTRLLYVRECERGCVYPCLPASVKPGYLLGDKRRAAADRRLA